MFWRNTLFKYRDVTGVYLCWQASNFGCTVVLTVAPAAKFWKRDSREILKTWQPRNFENVTAAKFWKRDSREILKTWQPRNFENVTLLVARRREHLRIFLAIFFVAPLPQKKTVFGHVIMHLDAWYGSHVSSKNSMPSPSATQRESIGRASAGIPSNTTTRSQTHVRQWKSEHWFSNNTWTMGWLRL